MESALVVGLIIMVGLAVGETARIIKLPTFSICGRRNHAWGNFRLAIKKLRCPVADTFIGIVLGATVLHELIGPVMAKLALNRSGETWCQKP